MTNLLDYAATDGRVILSGKRMTGTVAIRCARASNLLRTIRFGADRFGAEPPCQVNGIDVDIAGLYVTEHEPDDWRVSGYGYVRRYGEFEDASDAAIKAVREWAVSTAPIIAEQNPEAFLAFGTTDPNDKYGYHPSSTLQHLVGTVTEALANLVDYSTIAQLVRRDPGIVEPRDASDPEQIRWATHGLRDLHVSGGYDGPQPRPVVGRVVFAGQLIAYAVDARPSGSWHHAPDASHGPLFVPVEHATAADR